MSDLQCPATVLLVPLELIACGDSGAAARVFSGLRLSGFFADAASLSEPETGAAISGMATANDCPIERVRPLVDAPSLEQTLEELADLYRGETIAVIAGTSVIQASLRHAIAPSEPIAVAIDSSGWNVKQMSSQR